MGNARKLHEIWIEQCEAALSIKQRYGLDAAFDYLVAEKLLNFSEAATQHPTFAKELPQFVAEVRSIFTRKELCSEIERLEREERQRVADAVDDAEEDELLREKPEIVAARSQRFATLKALLTRHSLAFREQLARFDIASDLTFPWPSAWCSGFLKDRVAGESDFLHHERV